MRKSKKQRKYDKKRILSNRKLLKKYPWLASDFHPWTAKTWKLRGNDRYLWTWWDDMPRGWKIAFGDLLLKDLDAAIKRMDDPKQFYISQIKEKYGELRLYCGGSNEVLDLIDNYTAISTNVCLHCGKPDVGYTTGGWIMPICKECWDKAEMYGKYESSVCPPEDWKMPSIRKYTSFRDGEKKTVVVDISDLAEKVRIRYVKRNRKRV